MEWAGGGERSHPAEGRDCAEKEALASLRMRECSSGGEEQGSATPGMERQASYLGAPNMVSCRWKVDLG